MKYVMSFKLDLFICFYFNWHKCSVSLPTGNRILLSFRVFELESSEFCNDDYVELRKGSAAGPLIGVYCGSDIPSNITATHSIWIKFQSSGTGTASGFIADYSMCECQHLTSQLWPGLIGPSLWW